MKNFYSTIVFLLFAFSSFEQCHSIQIKDGKFLLDNRPFIIHAGEMHYARIPEPYWKQRLQMLKAMGLNTVSTYVFWNYHHPSPGVWNFEKDNHNLRKFLDLAKEVGLYVILRPGPYVCAEWDFGGFPWWLPTVRGLEIRTYNQPFLDSCKIYFQKLADQVKGYHISEGGPIILTQVENEFGSYVAQRRDIPLQQHQQYIQAIKEMLVATGFRPPYYTADGRNLFAGGHIEGILPSANGEDNIDSLKYSVKKYHKGEGPYMIGEFYPGWLDHWAEPFVKTATDGIVKQTEKYLKDSVNFSFYMIHGGTNFGYTSGANYTQVHPIQPDLTSYDYDAPVNEAGWAMDKYLLLRNLFQRYSNKQLPTVPEHAPVIRIPSVLVTKRVDFLSWVQSMKPVQADSPFTFEALGQGNGYVLYSVQVEQPLHGKLIISGLRDYATVYVNGIQEGEINRYYNKLQTDVDIPAHARLDILVESMGRINYGAKMIESLKGIIGNVMINETIITGPWKMYTAPLETQPDLRHYSNTAKVVGHPLFYVFNFKLQQVGDTFLDMKNWGKGIVFVNGHHIGRFWHIGPQQTLYVPGCWLQKGFNSIVVFDQQNEREQKRLSTLDHPVLDHLNAPQ
ncbi:MAG: beta-galactosidase [Bacteroidota bacterium]|nr:beta-galactosidase [Bacteroidota bacterium]